MNFADLYNGSSFDPLPFEPLPLLERMEVLALRRHEQAYELAKHRIIRSTPEGQAIIEPILGGAGERLFGIVNGAAATTAEQTAQPTGTAIRTMLQIEAGSAANLGMVDWGASFDGTTATNAPGKVALFSTTVAATMSSSIGSSDVTAYGDIGGTGSNINVAGTTHTGYATAAVTEGTVANWRFGDLQLINPTGAYSKQWPLGREWVIPNSKLGRVRMTFAVSVNTYIYLIWSE